MLAYPTIGLTTNRTGFRITLQRSVDTDSDISDFGQMQFSLDELDSHSPLGIGEGTIPAQAFQSGKPWFFSRFDATEKMLIGSVQTFQTVLSHLRVEGCQRLGFLFQERQVIGLLDISDGSLLMLISIYPFRQRIIIRATTNF